MPGQYNAQVVRTSTQAAREIKASAHYTYITNGITLTGSEFTAASLMLEGQCLVREEATGKFVPYVGGTTVIGSGYDFPVIADTSVKFETDDNGDNFDVIIGAVITHGAVYESMLVGVDDDFKAALAGAVRFY